MRQIEMMATMITEDSTTRNSLTYLAIIILTSMAVALPYWVPGWQLPKTEDFEYTVLPTMLFIRQVFDGNVAWWNPDVALGSPWPIPTGMTHSPFSLLFLWLPPMTVVGITVAGHTTLMGAAGLAFFRRYGLQGGVLAAALFTLQLSTAIEYLYWSDAIAVYVTWTMVAPMFLMVDIILRDIRSHALVAALAFGGIVGYVCLNGHIGVLSIYLVGLALFVLSHPSLMLRRLGFFVLAVVVAVVIGAEKLTYLLVETRLFSPDTLRDQQGLNGGIWGLIYNGFLRPLFIPDPRFLLEARGWLSAFVAANSFSRTLGFGAVFTALAIIAVAAPQVIRPFRHHRALAVTFVVSTLLMLWPVRWLPVFISATWPLRDVALVVGVVLAGLAFAALKPSIAQRWGQAAPSRILGLQFIVVGISALALIVGPNWLSTRGKETTAFYNALADGGSETPYLSGLIRAVTRDGQPGGRFVVTGEAERMMDIEMLVDAGAVNNLGPVHGLSEVSFIAKGISYDTIRPSQLVPYGTIAGDRMKAWKIDTDQHTDWTRDDQALLTFLGIEGVVAAADESVTAPGLSRVHEFVGRDGFGAVVYANSETLPVAFQVPAPILNAPVGRREGCSDEGLYCLNLGEIVSVASSSGISADVTGDQLLVELKGSAAPQSILLTQMFRPDWHLDAQAVADGVTLTSWNGIMRLEVPSGVEAVAATYLPRHLILARHVTVFGSLIWLVAILVAAAMTGSARGRRFASAQTL
jgi:hypothetical protein